MQTIWTTNYQCNTIAVFLVDLLSIPPAMMSWRYCVARVIPTIMFWFDIPQHVYIKIKMRLMFWTVGLHQTFGSVTNYVIIRWSRSRKVYKSQLAIKHGQWIHSKSRKITGKKMWSMWQITKHGSNTQENLLTQVFQSANEFDNFVIVLPEWISHKLRSRHDIITTLHLDQPVS